MEFEALPDELTKALSGLAIGPIQYFDSIGSTNDEAARWADAGASDLALVVADEQTYGRGRAGRRWFTPPGCALAFSLVLRFNAGIDLPHLLPRVTALAGLAVSDALTLDYRLSTEIKWPNDVLIRRRKAAGILAESHWLGDELSAVILGVGVNVKEGSVPPPGELLFPATSVEEEAEYPLDRYELLALILKHLLDRHETLDGEAFLRDWEERLAFRGEWVQILDQGKILESQLLGLNPDGSLQLVSRTGQVLNILTGDLRLRPAL